MCGVSKRRKRNDPNNVYCLCYTLQYESLPNTWEHLENMHLFKRFRAWPFAPNVQFLNVIHWTIFNADVFLLTKVECAFRRIVIKIKATTKIDFISKYAFAVWWFEFLKLIMTHVCNSQCRTIQLIVLNIWWICCI